MHLTAPSDARIQIVVIENALTPGSAEIVSAVQQQTPIKIHYRLEPRSGIPFARNAALDLANALGADWIALIDDDEYAEPDWLLKLYEALHCIRSRCRKWTRRTDLRGAAPRLVDTACQAVPSNGKNSARSGNQQHFDACAFGAQRRFGVTI